MCDETCQMFVRKGKCFFPRATEYKVDPQHLEASAMCSFRGRCECHLTQLFWVLL